MTTPLDEQLKTFLDGQAEAEKTGNTISAVRGELRAVKKIVSTVYTEISAVKLRQDRHGKRLSKLERAVQGKQEDDDKDDEDTARHQLNDYQLAQLAEKAKQEDTRRHDSVMYWKRSRWSVVASIAAILFATVVSGTCTYLMTHSKLEAK